ncbi:MAG: hypothetical protein JWN76_674 [Chitinophagaceae bacterium]|nr:hypothetical protein [Chitinophagaceae bacterium]
MFKNYIKTALRNLWKNKGFSAINIFGLAIGIATCLLISLYVIDELGYDRYNEKADRTYRINADIKFGEIPQMLAVCPDPLAATLIHDFPEVETAVRFRDYGSSLVKKGNENLKENRIIYTDSTVFKVFTIPFVAGDPRTALKDPNTVVISESTAKKYFGSKNAIGQTMRFDNTDNYKVSGIVKDMPDNSHFKYDFFVSLAGVEEAKRNTWVSFNFNTYVVLRKDANAKSFEKKLPGLLSRYIFPQAKQLLNITEEEFRKSGNFIKLSIIPLTDIHLHSDRIAELGPTSDIKIVYIFSFIAVFILLIACVNFMNLSTARSSSRAKEVGIRKVLGTQKKNLITQFLSESVLMSLLGFVIALVIAYLILPYFNNVAVKTISLSPSAHPLMLPAVILFAIVTGMVAGIYPAFYLSSFKPIAVLKGTLANGFKRSFFRNALVVFQFFISITLIISTIVIYSQLKFIQNKKLGFNKEQVLIIRDAYVLDKQSGTFKKEILQNSNIVSGTRSGYLPVNPSSRDEEAFFAGTVVDNSKAVSSQYWAVDEDYIKTFGMQIIAGRGFMHDMPTDSNSVLINETAAKLFGFKNAVGQKITVVKEVKTGQTQTLNVLGVIKDFNFSSLRQNIGALCMHLGKSTSAMSFRIKPGNTQATIDAVKKTWKAYVPGQPVNYSFLNEDFDEMYRTEQRSGQIFIAFAVLAILIACLGLFGLVTYAAEQRIKEIGIRKVLGASVANVVGLLAKDFIKLVMIAFVIAAPVAWYFMHTWLQDFAYRINMSVWIFAGAAILALVIAFVTVSFQAIKAAIANPVKSLRTE